MNILNPWRTSYMQKNKTEIHTNILLCCQVSGAIYSVYSEVPAPYINDGSKTRNKFVTLKQNGDQRNQDQNVSLIFLAIFYSSCNRH